METLLFVIRLGIERVFHSPEFTFLFNFFSAEDRAEVNAAWRFNLRWSFLEWLAANKPSIRVWKSIASSSVLKPNLQGYKGYNEKSEYHMIDLGLS